MIEIKSGMRVKFTDPTTKTEYIGNVIKICKDCSGLYEVGMLKKDNDFMKKDDIYFVAAPLLKSIVIYDENDTSMKTFKCMSCFKEFDAVKLENNNCRYCKAKYNLVLVEDV